MTTIRKTTLTEQLEPQAPPLRPEDVPPEVATGQTLWEFMEFLPEPDWGTTVIYLYQLEPTITKKVGEPAYLAKYARIFDQDEVRALAPQGREFMAIAKRPRKIPVKFYFALAPISQPTVAVSGPAQVAVTGTDPTALKVVKEMAEQIAGGKTVENIQKAYDMGTGLLAKAYDIAMTRAAAPQDKRPSLLQELTELRTAGFLAGPNSAPAAPTTQPAPVEFVDQIKKISEVAGLLGWKRIEEKVGEEGWKLVFAQRIPDIMNGLNSLAEKIGTWIPRPAGSPSSAPATSKLEEKNPDPQSVVDAFLKSKLVEFARAEVDPPEVLAWLEMTAPAIIASVKGHPIAGVAAFFSGDAILNEVVASDGGKAWLDSLLKAINKPDSPQPSGSN